MTKKEEERFNKIIEASGEIEELLHNKDFNITEALQALFTACLVSCTNAIEFVATAKDDAERMREHILRMADILTQSIKNYKPQSE